jgi:hypothetical protein
MSEQREKKTRNEEKPVRPQPGREQKPTPNQTTDKEPRQRTGPRGR